MNSNKTVTVGSVKFANHLPLCLIAGPCSLESEQLALDVAGQLLEICQQLSMGFVFKTSFDKANRTGIESRRGLGLEKSLPVFQRIRKELGIPCITDVHTEQQIEAVKHELDIIQIPAFLSRQTDLLLAAGNSGCAVNIKKGQFLAPEDMQHAAAKVAVKGNHRIMLCERGSSFGYHNLVVDLRALPIMAKTGYPVVMDATHAVQRPAGGGDHSSGDREFAPMLAKAAVAIGVAAVFIETHPDPDQAICDGPNMLPLATMPALLQQLKKLDAICKGY